MKRFKAVISALLVALVLSSCSSTDGTTSASTATYDSSANVLSIVAGSEQQSVFDAIVVPWCQSQGLNCKFTRLGSVDQARLLKNGNAPYDAFWFASSVFQRIGDPTGTILADAKPMFLTPVVFAGWKSQMERLGFVDGDVTIEEILKAVESKEAKVWVTNPTQSNSGATVLMGFLNYFAGNGPGDALTPEQLQSEAVQSGITRFVRAFDQTPSSTGTLMNDCVANQAECQTLFTYEDLVIEENKQLVAEGKEPLYVVYPPGSLAISDAPLGFYPHGDNPEKKANFKKLQDFLLTESAQQQLLNLGRRPINSIGLSLANAPVDVFNPDWGIKATLREQPITFPTPDVIQTALEEYQTTYRTPVDAVYCIDGSGSMDGTGWDGVRNAAELLFNPEVAKQYLLQINPADSTSVLIFANGVKADLATVNGNDSTQLIGLRDQILSNGPGGGTAIYNCLAAALAKFNGLPTEGRKRLIILMTDGQDEGGGAEILDSIAASEIPVIAVGFGSGIDSGALENIATRTGGTYIPAGNDLASALRSATGYK